MPDKEDKKEHGKDDQSEGAIKPDPETLHTTDPQEHMSGPISSLVRELGEGFDDEEAAKKVEDEKKSGKDKP